MTGSISGLYRFPGCSYTLAHRSENISAHPLLQKLLMILSAIALIACGGGGGSSDSGSTPTAATPTAVILNAKEELAYKVFVLDFSTTPLVNDGDGASGPPQTYRYNGRKPFQGLFADNGSPTQNTGTAPIILPGLNCTAGGSKTQTSVATGNPDPIDARWGFLFTYSNCADTNDNITFTHNGTQRGKATANAIFYAAPNAQALESFSVTKTVNETFSASTPVLSSQGKLEGEVDIAITDPARIYRFKDYRMTNSEGLFVNSNLTLTIDRSTEFGDAKPFFLTSITGSLAIDNVTYQVSSSANIPWVKQSFYVPTAGTITMLAPNGERIQAQYTPAGITCALFPAGTTTASITLPNCFRGLIPVPNK